MYFIQAIYLVLNYRKGKLVPTSPPGSFFVWFSSVRSVPM